ncbi:hypothetical protein NIES4073_19690 [Kalymmatonema gypsitolerans NIES-4073]|nr:hypothetical protein NIES4073_19690 [Scytonema sp. NIES-4073]
MSIQRRMSKDSCFVNFVVQDIKSFLAHKTWNKIFFIYSIDLEVEITKLTKVYVGFLCCFDV